MQTLLGFLFRPIDIFSVSVVLLPEPLTPQHVQMFYFQQMSSFNAILRTLYHVKESSFPRFLFTLAWLQTKQQQQNVPHSISKLFPQKGVPNGTCTPVSLIPFFYLNPEIMLNYLLNFFCDHSLLIVLLCLTKICMHVTTKNIFSKVFSINNHLISSSLPPLHTTSNGIMDSQDQKRPGLMLENFTKEQMCWCSFKLSVRVLTF